ncbi:hypothetical protein Bbelb_209010 [Branchiostoma belcheri]|nr:hypothetical protein Bbelb_209010 [Branchiostoma belcheri]
MPATGGVLVGVLTHTRKVMCRPAVRSSALEPAKLLCLQQRRFNAPSHSGVTNSQIHIGVTSLGSGAGCKPWTYRCVTLSERKETFTEIRTFSPLDSNSNVSVVKTSKHPCHEFTPQCPSISENTEHKLHIRPPSKALQMDSRRFAVASDTWGNPG